MARAGNSLAGIPSSDTEQLKSIEKVVTPEYLSKLEEPEYLSKLEEIEEEEEAFSPKLAKTAEDAEISRRAVAEIERRYEYRVVRSSYMRGSGFWRW
jgi:hypothetical protein